jgi:nucleotidyltransferase substrate binding protein (TIGR01987 family)
MTLDIRNFENAIDRLTEGLARYRREAADVQIRDGLVQRFEFTYEIGVKTLKRFLEWASETPGIYDTMAFADRIRSANEAGLLLHDWAIWRGYRDMRSKTSHAYDEAIAIEVVAGIPGFLEEMMFLRDELRRRLA